MYDAIVVGARVAGAPTAMLLARKGYRVLLLDRAAFPSDTLSTHAIRIPGIAALQRWGLLDRVSASGCPPQRALRLTAGGVTLEGWGPAVDGIRTVYCPRRTMLDTILVEAAVQAGAELRERLSLQEPVFEGGCVVGVRGRNRNGGEVV